MKVKDFFIRFVIIFILTLVTGSVVSYLYSLIARHPGDGGSQEEEGSAKVGRALRHFSCSIEKRQFTSRQASPRLNRLKGQ